jgi:plastocyanin
MKRRDFVSSVLVGGLAAPVIGEGRVRGINDTGEKSKEETHNHDHGKKDERSTNHTVSFGFWNPTPGAPVGTTPPATIDRFGADPNPRFLNGHFLTPQKVKVRVGDTVSFVMSGFHNLLIYGPGTKPEDIDRTILAPPLPNPPAPAPPLPAFPPLIADPENRLYRGLDPRVLALAGTQDRVEVVGFNTKGKYLVMCGVLPHFFDAATQDFVMFGYVDVKDDD